MKDDFLVSHSREFGIDLALPIRLQKRALMRGLGLPSDGEPCAVSVSDQDQVSRIYHDHLAHGEAFLVIVSEKPMLTAVPPLFQIQSDHTVEWRDDQGRKRIIDQGRALQEILKLRPATWVEFTPVIWGPESIAGHVLYLDGDRQVLEMQRGVLPNKILFDRQLPAYTGELQQFTLDYSDYIEASYRLREVGYANILPATVIRSICHTLQSHSYAFAQLARIAPMPTWEFALLPDGRLVSVDIDWPSQWLPQGRE
ncbi:MAG: hypothetical protein WC734_03765 [Patescibacteria group bacterium]